MTIVVKRTGTGRKVSVGENTAAAMRSAAAAETSASQAATDASHLSSSLAIAAASATLAADAIADATAPIYATKADATADLASIAEGDFIQVLEDEDREGDRILYRKQTTLVFAKNLSLGKLFYLEDFGGVADGDPSDGSGTVNDAAFNAFLAAWYAAGGGTLYLRGCYRFTSDFTLPNDGSTDLVSNQPPLKITGNGCHCSGQGEKPGSGSIMMWTAGSSVGRIKSFGLGTLVATDFTIYSKEGAVEGNGRAAFYTTNTTFLPDRVAFWTDKKDGNCDDDFWIAGGVGVLVDGEMVFDNSETSPFQGYGSLVQNCFFNGVRRGLFGRTFFNANRFINNTFWQQCGSNLSVGARAPIEIVGGATSGSTSNSIKNNLLEIRGHYDYGIILDKCNWTEITGNDTYDAEGQFISPVYVKDNCVATMIWASLADNGGVYVTAENDDFSSIILITAETARQSRFPSINAIPSSAANPNRFGASRFVASGTGVNPACLTIQPEDGPGNNTEVFQIVRQADASTDPGVQIFAVSHRGEITVGGDRGGEVVHTTANGAGYDDLGRTWYSTADHTIQATSLALLDTGEARYLNFAPAVGGSGKGGLQFGTGTDATLYRQGSGVLRSNGKLTADGGIGVGNSANGTTLGTITKKMEVFDASGTSLGFVPIYDAIT